MSRVALPITQEFIATIAQMMDVDPADNPFGDFDYFVITLVSETEFEFNLKLMSADQVFEEYKNDPSLEIIPM